MVPFKKAFDPAKLFKSRLFLLAFIGQFFIIVSVLGYRQWLNTSAECVACHADRQRLSELGFPELYVTAGMAEKETKHANTTCRDCHLGNGRAKEKDKAHDGMLKALFISHEGRVLKRSDILKGALMPGGDDRIRELLPKVEEGGQAYPNPSVRNLLWQDRNPETFNFDPEIAKITCGKSGCHPEELKQLKTTVMGINFRQRTMRTWQEPYGPHNCGPSFADLPPSEVLEGSGFGYENTGKIAKQISLQFAKGQAEDKQRFCNVCHVGCLDCHYKPDREKGAHNFVRIPPSESCAGGGRGTSICHPGAMQSRRGETYIGGSYSVPEGMEPDAHYKKGIHCADCHPTGPKGMGDMTRKATCQDCHIEAEGAHARSVHRNMDCSTCHLGELRGYQLTVWGPGEVAGKKSPFKKYSLYYGIQSPPVIMKDQKGRWMPVKVWPHSLGNFKDEVPPAKGIAFRWPKGETRDAYYLVGTVNVTPKGGSKGNRHLLWLEIEQAAHPFGKARGCASCHAKDLSAKTQVAVSRWEFADTQGAEPFEGTHRIVGDGTGLRIEGLNNTTPIRTLEGYELGDFASWLYFKDMWRAPGDFSIRADVGKYKRSLELSNEVERELKALERESKSFGKKRLREFGELKETVLHNEEGADRLIEKFRNDSAFRK
jgi:hypothetical protein